MFREKKNTIKKDYKHIHGMFNQIKLVLWFSCEIFLLKT